MPDIQQSLEDKPVADGGHEPTKGSLASLEGVEVARLFREHERRLTEMAILNEIGQSLSSAWDLARLLEIVYQQVGRLFDTTNFYIASYQEGSNEWTLAFHLEHGQRQPAASHQVSAGLTGYIIRNRKSLLFQTANEIAAFNQAQAIQVIGEMARSWLGVPLLAADRLVGVMAIQNYQHENLYSQQDLALFTTIAAQVANALENARLFAETENARAEAESLYNTSRLLTYAADFQEILAAAHGVYAPVLNRALLWDIERGAQGNVQAFAVLANWHSGVGMPPLPLGTRFPVAHFPATPLVLRNDPLFFEDIGTEAEVATEIKAMFTEQKARAVAILPLWISGRQVGILMLQGEQSHRCDMAEIRRYSSLAGQMAAVVENRRLFEQTQQQLANLAAIQTTVARLTAAASFEEAIDALLPQLSSMVQAETVSMFLCSEEQIVLAGVFSVVERSDLIEGEVEPLAHHPMTRRAIETRQPLAFTTDNQAIQPHTRRVFEAAGVTAVAIIPLVGREGVLGTLSFHRYQIGQAFTQREITLVQMLADQAATVFEKSRLLEQLQHRTVQLWTAADVSRAASSILDPAKLVQQAVDLICGRFGLYYVGLFLIDETGEWSGDAGQWAVLRAGTGEAGKQMVQEGHKLGIGGQSMIGACLADLQPHIAMDIGVESVRFSNPWLPETHAELALPLISRGKPIGALTIQSNQPEAFSSEDIAVLGIMGDQLANAIENTRLLKEAQAYAEEQAILRRITQAVGQTLKLQDLLETALDTALAVTRFDAGLVGLKDEKSGQLRLATQRGLPELMVHQLEENGLAGTLSDYTLQTGQPFGLSDLRQEAPVDANSLIQQGISTYVGVPLLHMDQTLGTLCFFHRSVRVLEARDRWLLEAIGRQVGVGVHNALLYQQTQAALAEVEATHRSYLRRSWQDYRSQRTSLERGAFVYERGQAKPVEGTVAGPGILQPEMERAVAQGSPAMYEAQGEAGERRGLALPITVRGQTIGVLGVEAPGDRCWTEGDIAFMDAVGDQLGQTLETARLFADTQRLAERERLIGEITAKIRASTDVRDILETTAVELGQVLGASRALVRVGAG